MKQKIIYTILLLGGMYLPASSKQCAKGFNQLSEKNLVQAKEEASDEAEAINSLPASPFSKMLLNL